MGGWVDGWMGGLGDDDGAGRSGATQRCGDEHDEPDGGDDQRGTGGGSHVPAVEYRRDRRLEREDHDGVQRGKNRQRR